MAIKSKSNNNYKISTGTKLVASKNKSKGKNKTKPKSPKKEENIVRGKEVTIRESASPAQIVYGKMKIGGVITFIHTSQDSKAYLVSGSSANNNQLLWTARTGGDSGNAISIEILFQANVSNTAVFTAGNEIVVVPRSNATNMLSTLDNVIGAIRANATANSLVTIEKLVGGTNGVVEALAKTNLQYGGGTTLHLVVTLAGHKIDGIEKLYLDDREVSFGASPDPRWATGIFSNKVFMALNNGDDNQTAQPDLMTQVPTFWTSDHRQRGCAHAYIILNYSESVFTNGFPEISFLVRGKPLYDPRTGRTEWFDNIAGREKGRNPALIINDFLTSSKYGLGLDNIDQTALAQCANDCEEVLASNFAESGFEDRYTIDGAFDTTDSIDKILQEMEQAIAGKIYLKEGKVVIQAGKWLTPSGSLDENDARAEIQFTTHFSQSETFNTAKGTFINRKENYNETDIPRVKNDTYIAEDGRVVEQDFPLNFVTSASQAQRVLKINLERIRQGITVSFPAKLTGLNFKVGQVISVNNTRFGWSSKYFEVTSTTIVTDDNGVIGVDLELQETASGIFDWNNGEETNIDIADNTTLPDPSDVAEPSNLILESGTTHLYIRQDGTVFSRLYVSWTPPNSPFVTEGGGYEIQYKQNSLTDWNTLAKEPASSTFKYILDVKDSISYDVRIRSVNNFNYASDWVTDTHTVIGKTEAPSNVTNFTYVLNEFGINLFWSQIPDLDADRYEVRVGNNWGGSTLIASIRGSQTRWDFKAVGTYHIMIKAVDSTGNYSPTEAFVDVVITAPTAPTLSGQIISDSLKLQWNAATSIFAIKEYEIRFGSDFTSGTTIATITGTSYIFKVTWSGTRTFWLAARDISGNISAASSIDISISNPNIPKSLVVTAIKNTVLIDWKDPDPSSLPIDYYQVLKGATLAGAILVGKVAGTFSTYVESAAGTYTYWVAAIDTAGNISAYTSSSGIVTQPSDFYIKEQNNLMLIAPNVLINAEISDDFIYLPIGAVNGASLPFLINYSADSDETLNNWLTANGWNNFQDAITAGYDNPFLSPIVDKNSTIQWNIDYGVLFDSGFLDFQNTLEILTGSITKTVTISYSPDNVSFTDVVASQVFATNFRYVKIKIETVGATNLSFGRITGANLVVSLKRETEYILVNVVSSDAASGGTVFNFATDFIDIEDIQATAWGNTFGTPVVNFTDVPNPTGGKVLLFDSSGAAISGTVRVSATGSVQP